MADIRLIVRPTLAGFGTIVGKDPPPCYEPIEPYVIVTAGSQYAALFSTKVGDEVAYTRGPNNTYTAVDPGTEGT